MKEIIIFKPFYLNRSIWLMITIVVTLSITLFWGFSITLEFIEFFSSIALFVGMLTVFYINRFEPQYIEIEDETIKVTYFNKAFFRQCFQILPKARLEIFNNMGIIKIHENKVLKVIIREKALSPNDWQSIQHLIVGLSSDLTQK